VEDMRRVGWDRAVASRVAAGGCMEVGGRGEGPPMQWYSTKPVGEGGSEEGRVW